MSVAAAQTRAAPVARELRIGMSPAPQRQFYQQGEADVDGLSGTGLIRALSPHHGQSLGRPRETGVEPAGPMLPEGEAFVEQHNVVPLRPLRLVDGERVAVVELVRLSPQREAELSLLALEEGFQHRDLDARAR